MPETSQLLRESWRYAVGLGEDFPLLFYGVLFDLAPEVADLFPPDMGEQRRHLVATLGAMVNAQAVDREHWPAVEARLRQLGKDHRRYGAEPDHYPVVGQALLETLEHFDPRWTADHALAWMGAIHTVAEVMAGAAAEEKGPPWLDLEILRSTRSAELVAFELAEVDDWPERYASGADVWVRRPDRPSGWVRGRLTLAYEPPTVVLDLVDLDAIVLSQTPEGAQLRLAPVFDLEAP
jgi:hemoglobin-like flavoprotein